MNRNQIILTSMLVLLGFMILGLDALVDAKNRSVDRKRMEDEVRSKSRPIPRRVVVGSRWEMRQREMDRPYILRSSKQHNRGRKNG